MEYLYYNLKIISGGQTGVDRGVLDAALALKIPCGGWCPKGRLAEDGVIESKYPLQQTDTSDYNKRTLKNILDSDGTVIIYFNYPIGGTEQTLLYVLENKKPYLLLDAIEVSILQSAQRIFNFIQDYKINIVNIAGPRASQSPKAYNFAKQVIIELFTHKF